MSHQWHYIHCNYLSCSLFIRKKCFTLSSTSVCLFPNPPLVCKIDKHPCAKITRTHEVTICESTGMKANKKIPISIKFNLMQRLKVNHRTVNTTGLCEFQSVSCAGTVHVTVWHQISIMDVHKLCCW